mgnify:CR=1 FL=1
MLTKFESFNTKGFFASGSEAVAVNFLVILFVPQARISKGALLVSPGALIFISLIFFLDILLNQIKLLISSQTFGLL